MMEMEQANHQQVLPTRRIGGTGSRFARNVAAELGLVVLIFIVWAGGGFRAIRSAYDYLRGGAIYVDSHVKTFGIARPGDRIMVSYKLANRSRDPIRIVGCQKSCNCILTDQFPFVLGPNESYKLVVSIQIPPGWRSDPPGRKEFLMTIYTSSPGQFEIPLKISGEVAGSPSTRSPEL